MSEQVRSMYVAGVSSATVTLSPEPTAQLAPAGTGVNKIVVTTLESTADPDFWGVTGTCVVMDVIFRRRL